MAVGLSLPHKPGYDFGVGVDRLSGSPMNLVVKPDYSGVAGAPGAIVTFSLSRISSVRELQTQLGISIEASYGCAAFGAGASARFSYLQESGVHSSSLFMTLTSTIKLGDLSIDHSELTDEAGTSTGRPDIFASRYGDVFCRAMSSGGIFVGVLRVDTFDSTQATTIEADLSGSYGLFSGEAETKFSSVARDYGGKLYYTLYYEGGPQLAVHHPEDPMELLNNANTWAAAVHDHPDKYARPYEWTLSPITIAEGPLPPNAADLQGAQDILTFCANERTDLLDELNQLNWYVKNQSRFDWDGAMVTPDLFMASARAVQGDLQVLIDCASDAINQPKDALYPSEWAGRAVPPRTYRAAAMPPLPGVKAGLMQNVVSVVGLRVSTLRAILQNPHRPRAEFEAWADSFYEAGQTAVKPKPEVYEFLTSGVKLEGVDLDGPVQSVKAFWTWVMAQSPADGKMPMGGVISLTSLLRSGGSPPPELRPIWGL